MDRIVMGLCTLFLNPSRIRKVAAALKPATLLAFHRALKERKYRRLFSPQRRGKPGPLIGVLISAVSIGSFFGAGGIALFGVMRYHGRLFCSGVVLQFLSLFLFALSPAYPLSFVFLLFTGFGSAGFSTMQSTIILITASPEKRGTSLGVLGLCIGVAAFGGLLIGAVADLMSARIAVAISSSLGLLLLVPLIAFSPLVWRAITPADTAETNEATTSDSIDAQQPLG